MMTFYRFMLRLPLMFLWCAAVYLILTGQSIMTRLSFVWSSVGEIIPADRWGVLVALVILSEFVRYVFCDD